MHASAAITDSTVLVREASFMKRARRTECVSDRRMRDTGYVSRGTRFRAASRRIGMNNEGC